MSKRGIEFFESWLLENINTPAGYAEEGKPHSDTLPLTQKCISDANAQGITQEEIEEDCGEISDRIEQALEEAVDEAVAIAASKDD